MHMSDALLSPSVALTAGVAASVLVGCSARRAGAEPQHARRVPLMGIMAAFVFAAQMINFSIPGTGSSGHIAGGLLLAFLLGPHAAFIAMASVLTVQCLLFADGGLLALGCNVLNMGFWPCFVGLPLFRRFAGTAPSPRRVATASVVAAVVALELGALGVVIETALSGRSDLPFTHFGAVLLGIHLPIGIVEGLVTAGVIRALYRRGNKVVTGEASGTARPGAPVLAAVAMAALLLSGVFAWFASEKPDGLEWATRKITGKEQSGGTLNSLHDAASGLQKQTAVMKDYQLPTAAPRLGLSAAGISGAVIAGLLVSLAAFASGRPPPVANRKFPQAP